MNFTERLAQARHQEAVRYSQKMIRKAQRRQPGVTKLHLTVDGHRHRDLLITAGWSQVQVTRGILLGTSSVGRYEMEIDLASHGVGMVG